MEKKSSPTSLHGIERGTNDKENYQNIPHSLKGKNEGFFMHVFFVCGQ